MPTDLESLDIHESVTLLLEGVKGIEAVPLDISLKIRNNIDPGTDSVRRFAEHLGVDVVLLGRVAPQADDYLFVGELIELAKGGARPLNQRGDNSPRLAEAVAAGVLALLGVRESPGPSRCSPVQRAGNLFSMGLGYWHRGEIDRAVSFFESVLEWDPNVPEALFRLGQCYLVLGDYRLAEEMLGQALLRDETALFQLRCSLQLFKVHRDKNELQTAETHLEQAFRIAESMGAERRLAYLWLEKGYFYLNFKKDAGRAADASLEAGTLLEGLGDKMGMANHAFLMATIEMRERQGNYFEAAMAQIDRAEDLAREMGYPQYLGVASLFRALNKKSTAAFSGDENLGFFLDAETYFQKVGSTYSLLWARIQRVDFFLRRAEYEQARALASGIRQKAAECGFFNFQIDAGNLLAQALMRLETPQEAVGVLENNLFLLGKRPVSFLKKNVLSRLVSAYLGMEAYDRALEISAMSLDHAQTLGDTQYRSLILNNHGEVLLLRGELAEAETYFQESLDLKKKIGNPMLTAWTLRNMALVYLHQGQLEKAARYLEQGRDLYPNPLADSVLEARLSFAENKIDRGNQLVLLIKKRFSDRWSDTLQEIFVDFETAGKAGGSAHFRLFLPNFL